jgi:hypothetical protein
MFNSPLLDKKIVVFIIGIIIGFIILYFVNSNKSSSLNCNTTEKFTHNNDLYASVDNNYMYNVNNIDTPNTESFDNNYSNYDESDDEEEYEIENFDQDYDVTENFDQYDYDVTENFTSENTCQENNMNTCQGNMNIPIPSTSDNDYAIFESDNTQSVQSTDSTQNHTSIKFYNFNTSWCGWSQKFQPDWDKFTNIIKQDPKLNKLIEVIDVKCDTDANKQLCIENNVEGYPTVIININGKKTNYDGQRTVDGLMSAVKQLIN